MYRIGDFALELTCFRCPVCESPLLPHAKTWACKLGHSFDVARQGYVNLLSSHDKKSRDPGDNAEMVRARSEFLATGQYQCVSELVGHYASMACNALESPAPVILDVGCGEGYYTRELRSALEIAGYSPSMVGMDISKSAIVASAKRSRFSPGEVIDGQPPTRPTYWLVASSARVPMMDASVNLICSIFSRIIPAEFKRVLQSDGHALVIGAGRDHLIELRRCLYDEVRQKVFECEALAVDDFVLEREDSVTKTLRLDRASLENLLKMTPHAWKAAKPRLHNALDLAGQPLTLNIEARLFRLVSPCSSV